MTTADTNDVPLTAGLVLLVLFLGLVGVGVATVVVPELTTTPAAGDADGGSALPDD